MHAPMNCWAHRWASRYQPLSLVVLSAVFILVAFFLASQSSTYSQENEATKPEVIANPHVWAVICSRELQQRGLSDLLVAEFSSKHSFELVERELLNQVVAELELATVTNAVDTSQRMKLGELLNADRLIVVSRELENDRDILKVVICDCQCGARLLVSNTDSTGNNVEQLSETCQRLAIETNSRFADGIKQFVGVAPFQSSNLSHRFDRYQKGFQYLLQSGLLGYPGVAVIETNEARSIQKELALTQAQAEGDRLGRVEMTLVDGSFEFRTNAEAADETVSLTIRLNDGAGKQGPAPAAMSLTETTTYLSKTLPEKLMQSNRTGSTLVSEFSQFKWLAGQAEQFRQRGDWSESVALCEAGLLLNQKEANLRRVAIGNYLSICAAPCFDRYELRKLPLDDPQVVKVATERETAYLAYWSHLEYLIRQRLITANEASAWVRTSDRAIAGRECPNYLITKEKKSALVIEKAEQDYIKTLHPLVLELPRDFSYRKINDTLKQAAPIEDEAELQYCWQVLMFNSVDKRIDRKFHTPEDLDRIYKVMTEEFPDDIQISNKFVYFFGNKIVHRQRPARLAKDRVGMATYDDWQSFLQKLLNSQSKPARLMARYALLQPKLQAFRRGRTFDGPTRDSKKRRTQTRINKAMFSKLQTRNWKIFALN